MKTFNISTNRDELKLFFSSFYKGKISDID